MTKLTRARRRELRLRSREAFDERQSWGPEVHFRMPIEQEVVSPLHPNVIAILRRSRFIVNLIPVGEKGECCVLIINPNPGGDHG